MSTQYFNRLVPCLLSCAVLASGCSPLSGGLVSGPPDAGGSLYEEQIIYPDTPPVITNCNLASYKTNVAPHVQTTCVGCHSAGGGALTLSAGASTDDAHEQNFQALITFISPTAASSSATVVMQKIQSTGGLSHSYKAAATSPVIMGFNTFINQYLANPNCVN